LIALYEDKAIRSGKYLLLLTPDDAVRFAEEAAASNVGTTGPNYWYGPGWEWYPGPDYIALVSEPDFVQRSLLRVKEDIERHLPESVAFVQIVLHDSAKAGPSIVPLVLKQYEESQK